MPTTHDARTDDRDALKLDDDTPPGGSQSQGGSRSPDRSSRWRGDIPWLIALAAVVAAGAALRLDAIGIKSLAGDEFATWWVSRMPVAESLDWQPELTKPPLYQLATRVVSSEFRPSERELRLPAAIAGILAIAAIYLAVRPMSSGATALAAAVLLALNAEQIAFSREARPYTFLLLGTILSTACWYRAVTGAKRRWFVAYIASSLFAFHSHYLAALVFPPQLAWWLIARRQLEARQRRGTPLLAMAVVAAGCVPIVAHYLLTRQATFQGLDWINAPTFASSVGILEALTPGRAWVWGLLAPALLLACLPVERARRITDFPKGPITLLTLWFISAFGGLLAMSLVGRHALVLRYALPASAAAIAIPLLLLHRVDRRLPLLFGLAFALGDADRWVYRAKEVQPGVRQMVELLHERVDPDHDLVVHTIDNTTFPGWEEMEQAVFRYYDLRDLPYRELHLAADGFTPKNDVLRDPRRLWLIVGWADEDRLVQKSGRTTQDICLVEGEDDTATCYNRLQFDPFRLLYIAPLVSEGDR